MALLVRSLLVCSFLVVARSAHLFDQLDTEEGAILPWEDAVDAVLVERDLNRDGTDEEQAFKRAQESSRDWSRYTVRSDSHYEYSEVLHLSILFFEAQRSGVLPEGKRIPWRSDSATEDRGKNRNEDLTGGWYDAGDHVKFGLPMAFSATVLGWGFLEYRDAYEVAGLVDYMRDCLKWAYDYFMKCHTRRNRFFYQVGDGDLDHREWNRPEDLTTERPSSYVDNRTPGSDVLGETVAALSGCSLIFTEVDPVYAARCLEEAKDLYRMATNWRGAYPQTKYYISRGYGDELMWAAAWLYRATNDTQYLEDAEGFYEEFGGRWISYNFGWGDKRPGAQLLMYQLTGNPDYAEHSQAFLDNWLPGTEDGVPYTPKGLAWRHHWGSLSMSSATSFLALMAADLGLKTEQYRTFAVNQIHYILGDAGHSFVVGFGRDPPRQPHHRASSCPDPGIPCLHRNSYKFDGPNHHVLYGALVGGPDENDKWEDNRANYYQNEPACNYNAVFQSAVAGLKYLELMGEL
ncbi:endoglucanase 4-like [Ptychodera flava]|uniref:endoglucanase 4-like n=1 Tax=Ptychodera flava TaxID=63121 RepID=UPI00396A3424